MKKVNLTLLSISLFALSLSSGCKKDKACRGYLGYATAIQDEASALSNAASAYGQNPTTANCEAYKAAYRDYIDALESQSKCIPSGDEASYQQSLDEARQELNDLKC